MAEMRAGSNIYLESMPTHNQHLVNMGWVIEYVAGNKLQNVRLIDLAGLTGTYDQPTETFTLGVVGLLEIDNIPVAIGDRISLKGQTDETQNGIYVVTVEGNATTEAELVRATDFNSSAAIVSGVTFVVEEGDLFANTTWKLTTTGTIAIDTSNIEFELVPPSALVNKFVGAFTGNGVLTAFVANHNLGTQSLSVTIKDLIFNAITQISWFPTDNNNITISPDVVYDNTRTFEVTIMG